MTHYTGQSGERGKICTRCKEWKLFDSYYPSPRKNGKYRSSCKACCTKSTLEYRSKNPGMHAKATKERRAKNRGKEAALRKIYYDSNREKIIARCEIYRQENKDVYLQTARKSASKKRATPKGRLDSNISRSVKRMLGVNANGCATTSQILGYSSEELMAHLESLFQPGMTWENYGRDGWHVDHIIPLSVFNYQNTNDADFKRAWALSNLQPLWAGENMSKGAKLTKDFQPSLAGL